MKRKQRALSKRIRAQNDSSQNTDASGQIKDKRPENVETNVAEHQRNFQSNMKRNQELQSLNDGIDDNLSKNTHDVRSKSNQKKTKSSLTEHVLKMAEQSAGFLKGSEDQNDDDDNGNSPERARQLAFEKRLEREEQRNRKMALRNKDNDDAPIKMSSRKRKGDKLVERKGKRKKANTLVVSKEISARVPVPIELVEKYRRAGDQLEKALVSSKVSVRKHGTKVEQAVHAAARAELLLNEEAGFMELDEGEDFTSITQRKIKETVDITSAAKSFNLDLRQFGPYVADYFRNGRNLVLGGRKGHIASFDWITKKLQCEINVMESVHAVKWLHVDTMYAVAQKNWTYIYDTQGVELHCLKRLSNVIKMEFLPYHFLLVTASETGFLTWVDISVGSIVKQFNTRKGRLPVLKQNPTNALVATGHANGVVRMWSPNCQEPVLSMLCHKGGVTDVAFDKTGTYMATSSSDRFVNLWDVRVHKSLKSYRTKSIPTHLDFSQRSLLAMSMQHVFEVYRDVHLDEVVFDPYMRHMCRASINSLQFCPHEDVVGVATAQGFESLLVPGAGEPNFDALEVNPFMTKSQRREMEVKALLDKIPSELIALDQSAMYQVREATPPPDPEDSRVGVTKAEKLKFNTRRLQNKSHGTKVLMQAAEDKKVLQLARAEEMLEKREREEEEEGEVEKRSVLDRFNRK